MTFFYLEDLSLNARSVLNKLESLNERERERDEVKGYSYRDMIWVFYANYYSCRHAFPKLE